MVKNTSRRCEWCGRTAPPESLRARHGKWAPTCLRTRVRRELDAMDWVFAGIYARVLAAAGLTRLYPRKVTIPIRSERIIPDTGEIIIIRSWGTVIEFRPACPRWARDVARRLRVDRELSLRLGYVQKRAKLGGAWTQVRRAKPIPFDERARLLRVMAADPLARELGIDDVEVLAILTKASRR